MDPFEHETRRLLGDALARINPHPTRAPRAQAADKLLQDFVALAVAQGLEGGKVQGGGGYYVAASTSFSVRLMTDGETFMLQQSQYHHPAGEPRHARLAFDCVTSAFEGIDVDPDVAPTPGQRLPRVHALVVLARLAAELLSVKLS